MLKLMLRNNSQFNSMFKSDRSVFEKCDQSDDNEVSSFCKVSGLDKDLDQWVVHPLLLNLMSILLHI